MLIERLTGHSDAENPRFVYEWRQEQERTLRAAKGAGMTEEQVNHFVDGCMYTGEVCRAMLTNPQITHPTNCSLKPSARALSSPVRPHLIGKADSFALWLIATGEFKKSLKFDQRLYFYYELDVI